MLEIISPVLCAIEWSDLSEVALKSLAALSPALVGALSWLSIKGANWIAAKTTNEYMKGVYVRLNETVMSAVREADQVFVAEMKEASVDGKITPEERVQIKTKVINTVKSHFGMKGLAELSKIFGLSGSEVDKFLSTKVEAAVQVVRLEKDVAAVQIPQMPRG